MINRIQNRYFCLAGLFLSLLFVVSAQANIPHDFYESEAFTTVVNGTERDGLIELRVTGYNPDDDGGLQYLTYNGGSYYGQSTTVFSYSDGSTYNHTGRFSSSKRRIWGPYLTNITTTTVTNEGETFSLSYSFGEPQPCGPINFSRTYKNPTAVTEWYRYYIGSALQGFFLVPPHGSFLFEFQSDSECDSLRIIKELDGEPMIEMDEVAPDAPDSPEDPQFPELGTNDSPYLEFDETEIAEVAGDGNLGPDGLERSDLEKQLESDWLLWKGTDDRLKTLTDKSGEMKDEIILVGDAIEGGLSGLEGAVGSVELGIGELGTTLNEQLQNQETEIGIWQAIRNKIDDIYDVMFFWSEDVEPGQGDNGDWDSKAGQQNALAEEMVDSIPIPEMSPAAQTFTPQNAGWPVFTLPILGQVDTNPYTRFPAINQYGALCRNVMLVIIWLMFVKRAHRDCQAYIVGVLNVPGTTVNTGSENVLIATHVIKALVKSSAIVVAVTAFISFVFVYLNLQTTGLGMGAGIETAVNTDISAIMSSFGPVAVLVNTFFPVPEFFGFFIAGVAFPFAVLPAFLLAGFIVRLIPL